MTNANTELLVLCRLLFLQNASLSDLHGTIQQECGTSLRRLQDRGFVNESDGTYSLTRTGKQFAQDIETDGKVAEIVRRPKISILVTAITESNVLLVRRLKTPFYGYLGFVTGKPHFGELFEETARREFEEETGLSTQKVTLRYSVHELNYDRSGELLEDKVFVAFLAENVSGEPRTTKEAEPFWVTHETYRRMDNKFYDLDDLYQWFISPPRNGLIERSYVSEGF